MFKSKLLLFIVPVFLITAVGCSTNTSNDNRYASNNRSETAGQYVSDSEITANVKSELFASKHVKGRYISVTTENGVVTLSGKVHSVKQQHKAVKIAWHVRGVKSVNDQLVVVERRK